MGRGGAGSGKGWGRVGHRLPLPHTPDSPNLHRQPLPPPCHATAPSLPATAIKTYATAPSPPCSCPLPAMLLPPNCYAAAPSPPRSCPLTARLLRPRHRHVLLPPNHQARPHSSTRAQPSGDTPGQARPHDGGGHMPAKPGGGGKGGRIYDGGGHMPLVVIAKTTLIGAFLWGEVVLVSECTSSTYL